MLVAANVPVEPDGVDISVITVIGEVTSAPFAVLVAVSTLLRRAVAAAPRPAAVVPSGVLVPAASFVATTRRPVFGSTLVLTGVRV